MGALNGWRRDGNSGVFRDSLRRFINRNGDRGDGGNFVGGCCGWGCVISSDGFRRS